MLIEMSYPISPDSPIFPGLPADEFFPHTRMKNGDPSNTTMVRHFIHNGTHVDSPFHFYDKGQTIDQVAIDSFMFSNPLVIDLNLLKGELITINNLRNIGDPIHNSDILLFSTGYYKYRQNKSKYTDDFPSLSKEAAEYIRCELGYVKAVAIDTLSIESSVKGPLNNFIVHKTLLDGNMFNARPLLIFEDVNLAEIINKSINRIFAFPIRFVGLDGSPVSIVAEVL